jgi:cytochrome P450
MLTQSRINVNSVPTMITMLVEILSDPALHLRVEAEVLTAVSAWSEDGVPTLDVERLMALPLLHSTYLETLRTASNIGITGVLLRDIPVGAYTLQAGNMVTAPTILSHYGSEWSVEGHPSSQFYADRFLEPVKTPCSPLSPPPSPTCTAYPIKSVLAAEQERLKAGSFFPFGGGGVLCPGRFFAKQEILTAVAMVLAMFEMSGVQRVEVEEKGGWRFSRQPRGVMWPNVDVRVRLLMRRRSPRG